MSVSDKRTRARPHAPGRLYIYKSASDADALGCNKMRNIIVNEIGFAGKCKLSTYAQETHRRWGRLDSYSI